MDLGPWTRDQRTDGTRDHDQGSGWDQGLETMDHVSGRDQGPKGLWTRLADGTMDHGGG